jgi:hypothetical protein
MFWFVVCIVQQGLLSPSLHSFALALRSRATFSLFSMKRRRDVQGTWICDFSYFVSSDGFNELITIHIYQSIYLWICYFVTQFECVVQCTPVQVWMDSIILMNKIGPLFGFEALGTHESFHGLLHIKILMFHVRYFCWMTNALSVRVISMRQKRDFGRSTDDKRGIRSPIGSRSSFWASTEAMPPFCVICRHNISWVMFWVIWSHLALSNQNINHEQGPKASIYCMSRDFSLKKISRGILSSLDWNRQMPQFHGARLTRNDIPAKYRDRITNMTISIPSQLHRLTIPMHHKLINVWERSNMRIAWLLADETN